MRDEPGEKCRQQTAEYGKNLETYRHLAGALEEILRAGAARNAPGALVQSRPKAIASFAEKILRKGYSDPLAQMTDLAGARVVVYCLADVEAMCAFVEGADGIEIDRANSANTLSRLNQGEFGYRAVHYVVSLRSPRIAGVKIPHTIRDLKAEIQICTFLQHVWSAIGHDRIYKSDLVVPASLKREIHALAATLESCDARFQEAIRALDAYRTAFDPYRDMDSAKKEAARWRVAHEVDPDDAGALLELGTLEMAAGSWKEADRLLRGLLRKDGPPARASVYYAMGRAAWRAGRVSAGRKLLRDALRRDGSFALALCELGDSHLADAPAIASEIYERALAIDPDEPRALVPWIECRIRTEGGTGTLDHQHGRFEHAVEECDRRIRLGVLLPDSFFQRGRLQLYGVRTTDDVYPVLVSYARGLVLRDAVGSAAGELKAVERVLAVLSGKSVRDIHVSSAMEAVRRLLLLGITTREIDARADGRAIQGATTEAGRPAAPTRLSEKRRLSLEAIATPDKERPVFAEPVVIVAGGCDPRQCADLARRYREPMRAAFAGFDGTVISGGTDAGVGRIVAGLKSPHGIRKIAYLPEVLPRGDKRRPEYDVVRTPGSDYGPVGPLQTWADLLLAGVRPGNVRVLGINGGLLSEFEYHLALVLGATVGLVEGSGRKAADLIGEPALRPDAGPVPLPEDPATIAAFVLSAHPGLEWISDTEKMPASADAPGIGKLTWLAMRLHYRYQAEALKKNNISESVAAWHALADVFKNSNRHCVRFFPLILRSADLAVDVTRNDGPGLTAEDPAYSSKLEKMAEREHGRFNAERLLAGWRRGPKDARRRTNPTLVPWEQLDEPTRKYDFGAMELLPKALAEVGVRIVASHATRSRPAGVIRATRQATPPRGRPRGSRARKEARRAPGRRRGRRSRA